MKLKVNGHPSKMLDPFHLVKTISFAMLALVNNTFAGDFFDDVLTEISSAMQVASSSGIVDIRLPDRPETPEERSNRLEREADEDADVKQNIYEVKHGIYYVDGKWVYPAGWTPKRPELKDDLIDSDNDGYDDYTEYTHGTNWKDSESRPAVRDGNNKIIFKK